MTIAKYCKQKGFTKEEYKNFKSNIEETAKTIKSTLHYNGGMYYNVSNLFNWNGDPSVQCLIINELKKMNVEFFDNDKYYRVVE